MSQHNFCLSLTSFLYQTITYRLICTSETLVVEELVSHFPFPNSQGELHLLSILPTNQSRTLRSYAHVSSSIRNLIPPQASSLSRLFSCYESQTTQPHVQKNDFLQISLISHVMLLLCQVDRKFITVILGPFISLPGSHGKVMWPHAGPTFWGSSVYCPYSPCRDGYCRSHVVLSDLGAVYQFLCFTYRMMVCFLLLECLPTLARQPLPQVTTPSL